MGSLRRILDGELDREAEPQRDLVTGHQLLTRERRLLAAHVDALHGDLRLGVRPEHVAARREDARELALDVLETALVLVNDDVRELGAGDHLKELVGELGHRCVDRHHPQLDCGIDGPEPVHARTQERHGASVAQQDAALARTEDDLLPPLRRKDGTHLGKRTEEQIAGGPALHVEAESPGEVATRSEGADREAVAEQHRSLIEMDTE
jgi:hypothetical protein